MIMKILISISYYFPHISGLTNSMKNLAEELAKKGYAVSVIAVQHERDLALNEKINKVHVLRIPYLFRAHKGFIIPRYLPILFSQIWKNDYILISLPQLEGVVAALIGKLLHKKIVSVYACEIKLSSTIFSKTIEALLYCVHFATLLLSDKVITLSEDFAKHAKLLNHFKNKIVCIYPCVKAPVVKKTLANKVIDKKLYRIGFIGRISAEKGLEYLLNAIPYIEERIRKDFTILLAGPKTIGEKKYLKEIMKLANFYKHNITFVRTLKEDELGSFYKDLDVLVLPSINSTEAFGVVQVEAMLCGTPVVASNLPGVRVPIIATGMGELAEPKNSQDLAEKIVKILKDKRKYIKKREFIESKFSLKRTVSEYERLFA